MRSQEKAIIDAMRDGAFDAEAPFLSTGEFMAVAASVSGILGADESRMSRNTVEAWLKAGILKESARSTRNRLFSGIDVLRLAVVFHLTASSFPKEVAFEVSRFVAEDWLRLHFERTGNADRDWKVIDHRDFVMVCTADGYHHIRLLDSPEELPSFMNLQGLVSTVNAWQFVTLSFAHARLRWEEKAKKLLLKLKSQPRETQAEGRQ